jgi:putative sigma-54 modulation protein
MEEVMNISITARKFKAHESLKSHIQTELDTLKRFNDEILNAEVILSYHNKRENIKTAEVILHVPGQILTAVDDSDDFKKSTTGAVDKITRQLQKIKEKKALY